MVETGTHSEELARHVVGALKNGLSAKLVAVVLFGSRARGEGSETSDWDLLVIAEGLPAKTFDRTLYLKQLIPPEWRGRVSILAKTPEQFHGAVSSLSMSPWTVKSSMTRADSRCRGLARCGAVSSTLVFVGSGYGKASIGVGRRRPLLPGRFPGARAGNLAVTLPRFRGADQAKTKRRPFGLGIGSPNSLAVSIQSRIASCALPSATSWVAPCAIHPGSSGTSATNAPSSSLQ